MIDYIQDNFLEILALIFSMLALGVSLYYRETQRRTMKKMKEELELANEKSDRAIKTAQGQLEITLRKSISDSRDRLARASKDLDDFRANNSNRNDALYKKLFFEALEDFINTYERACMLYLDDKIDRERFKREYKIEIRKLVEEGSYKEKYFPAHSSKFKAILKIYEEWENQEK